MTVRTINEVFRDYVTDGVPSSGAHKPVKADIRDTLNDLLPLSNRERLSAVRTYYVRTDGDDANNGLANTSGGAFKTIQKAIDTVYQKIDGNGYNVTISVGAGTFTGANKLVGRALLAGGSLTISGAGATTIISTTNADCFDLSFGTVLTVSNMKVQTTTAGSCFDVNDNSALTVGAGMEFGACATTHLNCGTNCSIALTANYTISGGAGDSHWHAPGPGGLISCGTITITLTGTPNFGAYFCGTAQGVVTCPNVTFSGAATGVRYVSHYGGGIHAGGTDNSFLPGDAAGRADAGGWYVGPGGVMHEWVPEIFSLCTLEVRSINTADQSRTTRFKVTNGGAGTDTGQFFVNGNSYSSGRTDIGSDAQVVAASGTVDGISVSSKANIAAGSVVAVMSSNGAAVAQMRRRASDGASIQFLRDTSVVGSISVTGSATAYNTSSDYRLKEGDEPIEDAIERLNRLRPIEFAWKATGERVMGFFAHEIADVVPEAVHGEKDAEEEIGTATGPDGETVEGIAAYEVPEGFTWKKTSVRPVYQGIDQAKLVPLLTAALQATVKKIVDLEERLTALEP